MYDKLIEFKKLNYSYDGNILQLKDINFYIKKNEKVGIIGANGAGKSTLLKLILGLLNPSSGEVLYNSKIINKKSINNIRQKVGYAFQDPDNQLFMPTIHDDITFRAKQENKSEEECKKLSTKILTDIDALYLADKTPYKLSGGEKRLASVAVALSNCPELLVLDEPTVGLDPRSRRTLINLLKTRPETCLLTTHDMDMAYEVCDRIIIFFKGEVVADDTTEIIFNNKDLLEASHLEMPLQLQYSMPKEKLFRIL